MSSRRLKNRVESARVISSGILEKYKLMFHKVSDDGSWKCDAFFTDEVNDKIFGVIYSIHKKDLNKLDSVEGCGYGYEKKDVFIEKLNGTNSTGIIATHDLSLCEVANNLPEVHNYYFDAEIINDELHFDYRFKNGICQNMNASFLLRKMEIVDE